jgi:hypothetical protein
MPVISDSPFIEINYGGFQMPGHGSLRLWIALIGMAVASPICATPLGGIVAGNAFVALTQQPAPLHKSDTAIGLLAASQPMHIAVSLRLRNRVALESFLATAQQTGTPVAQRTMSPADFAAQLAPTRRRHRRWPTIWPRQVS